MSVRRDGSELTSRSPELLGRLSWRDTAGDHFVSWPLSPTDRDAVEVVVPTDPRQDAIKNTYDTSFGSSTADWRLTDKEVCTARGGYNDVLARYVKGETLDELTTNIGLTNRDETRILIRKALGSVQKRYWRDR